jgi:hypothetical protein
MEYWMVTAGTKKQEGINGDFPKEAIEASQT